jgi:ABC-2 type transport system ATP-binding protein
LVRSTDTAALEGALRSEGLSASPATGGGLLAEAEPAVVGAVAARHGVTLVELRLADGRGLEDMFLELTASSAREEVAA